MEKSSDKHLEINQTLQKKLICFNDLVYVFRVLENYSGEIWRSTRHPLTLFARGDEKFVFFCLVPPSDPSIRTEFRGSSVHKSVLYSFLVVHSMNTLHPGS